MLEIFRVTIIGLFFGTFGTTIGGIIGSLFEIKSRGKLSFILEFSAGLMLSIICFELIPESLWIADISSSLIGILFGVFVMMVCDSKVKKMVSYGESKNNDLLKTGIIVGIGLAIHNLPEGIAIGSGFESSVKLGVALAIAICFHDIPEGIAMAVPMRNGGMEIKKVIWYVVLSGVTTGIGAFIGKVVGNISPGVISLCLAFAGGAMLYIVSGELIPESKKMYQGRLPIIGNVVGFIVGLVAMRF